jgi:hypothetical protein
VVRARRQRLWASSGKWGSLVSVGIPKATNISKGAFSADVGSVLVVGWTALVLGLPMLLYGPLVDGHDTYEHLNFSKHFTEQFWSGNLYPRWLIGMNHGLGSPTYFVFPPLPAYVCALLDPVGRALHFSAFNLAAFLALLVSGVCAYHFLRNTAAPVEAAIGAGLFMAMPYHLVTDFYQRSAIPESWALAWMPLVLYFLPAVIKGEGRGSAGLAAAFALTIFSHLISVAMFSPVLIATTLFISPSGVRVRALVRVLAAMGLGAGISSIYLLPALANAKYISAARLVSLSSFNWTNHLLSLGKGLFVGNSTERFAVFLRAISWGDLSILGLATGCFLLSLKNPSLTFRRASIFWFVICCLSLLMCSRLSSPLWRDISRLQQAIQFPWRFSAILCIGTLSLLAILFSESLSHRVLGDNRVRILLSFIAVSWLCGYGYIWWRYRVATKPAPSEKLLVNDHDGWFFAWSPPGMDQRATLLAYTGPKVRFIEGNGTANAVLWSPRKIDLETNSSAGGWIMVNQFYYPTWVAKLKDTAASLQVRPAMPEGLLQAYVPAGVQSIRVEIRASMAEHVGSWFSVGCLLLCIPLWMNFSHPQRKQALAEREAGQTAAKR